MSVTSDSFDFTFVFPCLNEERTIGGCIQELQRHLESAGLRCEIVVADNGSTDRSAEIATGLGARVVPVAAKGYGEALKAGISAARTEYVIFADADSTYMLEDAAPLFRKARESNADLAIAARLAGPIEPGAMPFLHRYVGTPVLTALINVLFGGKLSDCNSGFRCVRRSAHEAWKIRAGGMEFASEQLIKALKARARIVEISSGLRCAPVGRVAHLRTWRDGMRHLLFILSERPRLFEVTGLTVLIISSVLQLLAALVGPTAVGRMHIFDLHSQALLLLAGFTGAGVYLLGCYLSLHGNETPLALTRRLVSLDEATLFFLLLAVFLGEAAVVGLLVLQWALQDFGGLHLIGSLLILIHFFGVAGQLAIGLLGIHIFKKSH